MGFQTPQLKLTELLADVGSGKIQLPDFQRGYKWDDERIRQLLVTVLRGHPMGALMLLETGGDHVRFKPQPIERVTADLNRVRQTDPAATLAEPDRLLLDGQQRMTSLYQSLTGTGIVETQDARGKDLERRYFLDVERALGDPSDQEEAVRSLPADGVVRTLFDRGVELDVSSHDRQVEAGLMPFTVLFGGNVLGWLVDYLNAGGPDDMPRRSAVVNAFNTQVAQPVTGYVVPAIQLDKQTTKEAVATVFEKVNSGGLPLNNFELLTAIFAGDAAYYAEHGDDFRLGEDWETTRVAFGPYPVLRDIKSTDFLQAVLLLATIERKQRDVAAGKPKPAAVSARGEDVLKLTLAEYLRWAPRVREGMIWAAGFYTRQHIHTSAFLPYRTQTVPLAVLRVLLGEQIDAHAVLARIRQWYWCGVLGELYGSTTESRFARDVEQVPAWALAAKSGADVPAPVTVQDSHFVESRLLSMRTRNSAAYKGLYALLMTQHCIDWRVDQAIDQASYLDLQIDVHHIFPKAWCEKNGIDPDLRESIVNKTPLAKKTNIFLRGDSPAVYLPRLEKDTTLPPEHLDRLLRTHLVDPALLRAADFGAFFDARREALVGLIEQATGKRVTRDVVVQDGSLHGSEDAAAFEPEPDDPEDGTTLSDVGDETTIEGAA
ncbi:hypothetical protein SAMN05518682_1367 [Cellulosimicrobium aquatile]|uniref:GmrSD restriction endonucleases N-terminal domain-containing protein n=1 Tax=Cellulosimicrobium aquatile TaxID=1612203 RepID=A0A1N6Q6C7_9MICO|nr:DUF262 domain-containing protein [Cellulosimicrobium aquatile]SIQ12158.1 hypothetical protein SAMN05518682_1367 [Cellulosimicrobium aquatile]